jgi:uncharacterized membrane protein
MDYNYLNKLYNAHGNETLEWVCDAVPLPPGASWETESVLLPTDGIRRIAHASRHVVAGLEATRNGGAVRLEHTFRQGLAAVDKLAVSVRVEGAVDGRVVEANATVPQSLGTVSELLVQTLDKPPADPLIVTVTVKGTAGGEVFEETYWDFHAGDYGYGDNIQQDMVTPLYVSPAPAKQQDLPKPERLARVDDGARYFLMWGMLTQAFRLEDAFAAAHAQAATEKCPAVGVYSLSNFGDGPTLSVFPYDYDALMRYDAIVASNVRIDSAGGIGQQMIDDYLRHGGGLLVLGGKSAYGAGGWADSVLREVLPVEVSAQPSDMVHTPGLPLSPGDAHWITEGIQMAQMPRCEYSNRVSVRPGADVLLRVGNAPFLVVWERQGARVACCMGAPYGDADAAETPLFYRWTQWPELLARTLRWLGRRETAH